MEQSAPTPATARHAPMGRVLLAGPLLLLAGCGGGGGGDPVGSGAVDNVTPGGGVPSGTYTMLTDTDALTVSDLRFLAVDNALQSSTGDAGALDHDDRSISGGTLAGNLSADFSLIALVGGGEAELTNPDGTAYTRVFRTTGGDALFGVVGQPTILADIPGAGQSTYNGRVILQAYTDDGFYALNGDARVTVNWDAAAETRFSNLDGRRNDIEDVTNVGTVTVRNAPVSGTGFTGGTLTTSGAAFALSGAETLTQNARFFGPNALELGGTVVVADPAGLNLSAVFVAN